MDITQEHDQLVACAARWIWLDQPRQPNTYACFRRVINVQGPPTHARLIITADARHEVHINDQWVGHGPPRAWSDPWPVESHEVTTMLRPGRNVVTVLVMDWGIGTMQYLLDEPGLLAHLSWHDARGRQVCVTDGAWRAMAHPGYPRRTPRMSIPLAWEEQFDARTAWSADPSWRSADFDDRHWPQAQAGRLAGVAPHATLRRFDIAPLTRQTIEPVAPPMGQVVRAAPITWSLNLRPMLDLHADDVAVVAGRLIVATWIHSDTAQALTIQDPHQLSPWVAAYWKLNGHRFGAPDATDQPFADLAWGGQAHHVMSLRAGWNLLLGSLTPVSQVFRAVLTFRPERPITFHAAPQQPSDAAAAPWLVLGPFDMPADMQAMVRRVHHNARVAKPVSADATMARFERIWTHGALDEQDRCAPLARRLPWDCVAPVDVFALCASEQVVPGVTPDVRQHEAGGWVVHPADQGDVRLLLDYGKELVGFHELDLDAPQGTCVDVHGFEFMQDHGQPHLAHGMNNTFRYICRQGRQRYRSCLRRGLRYAWVTLRHFDRPVHLHGVRAIMSAQPFDGPGQFDCSDELLTRIWQVGRHTVRCCAEDTYTDCPSYEQVFWVGDGRNEAQVDLLVNGDPRLSRHSWLLAAQSLERSPLVESHVPSAWRNVLPAWSFLWMRWAREHHLLTGDDAFARQACPWLDRNAQGIVSHLDHRGLFRIDAWNMFDWAPMDTPPDAVVTHQNALAVLGLRDAAEMAQAVGESSHARRWSALADNLSMAINRWLWDDGRQAYVDALRDDGRVSPVLSQQTHTAVYIAKVAQGARAARCRQVMADPPVGFVRAGSPFFMFFLLEALAAEGDTRQMAELVRDYWGAQIRLGATTFWEMYHPDAPRKTRSHCHGWSAAPTVFLTQYLLGVRPLEPGYRRTMIAPGQGLDWARGVVPTPHGPLHVEWRRDSGRLTLHVDLPPGVEAVLDLPDQGELAVTMGQVQTASGKWAQPGRLLSHSPMLRLVQQVGV